MEGFVRRGVRKAFDEWVGRKRFKMGKMAGITQQSHHHKSPLQQPSPSQRTNSSGSHIGNVVSAAASSQSDANLENFSVGFRNMPVVRKIRDLRTKLIGKLVTIQGTVTRTSEVLPELIYGRFQCLQCGTESANIEQQFKFTQPTKCQNPTCVNTSKWQLDMNRSVFADWQRIRVQENQNEIPSGSMPRCIDIILRNTCVERAKAGDKAKFSGSLLVVPDVSKMFYRVKSDDILGGAPDAPREDGSGEAVRNPQGGASGNNQQQYASEEGVRGLKALGVRDLGYKLCFLCNHVNLMSNKGSSSDHGLISSRTSGGVNASNSNMTSEEEEEEYQKKQFIASLTVDDITKISEMKNMPDIYDKLFKSIAPNIYGHDEVKKGILLMMFGGVHKVTPEGINLRGDLNVCIVGDPGTAKSQFLKYIAGFLPRAVYTSGKASSAAGLTATVVKDNERGEFTIEAGALMLADNGVCCIDEFDKMDEKDQVAIHEAMEQQTISIAKAGIRATLNARTSILAAANPIGGRYNPRKTLRANLNISPPIMSRFDLFFVVRDECKREADLRIADHVIKVHRGEIEEIEGIYSTEDVKLYLQYCRLQKPQMSREAKEELVAQYKQLRQQDKSGSNAYRITVRQLESMIRLSEALARLHCADRITLQHVREAVTLLQTSITKVQKKATLRSQTEDTEQGLQSSSNRATLRLMKMTQQKIEDLSDKLTMSNLELTTIEEKIKSVTRQIEMIEQNDMENDEKRKAIKHKEQERKELTRQKAKLHGTVQDLRTKLHTSVEARTNLKNSTTDEKVLERIRVLEAKWSQTDTSDTTSTTLARSALSTQRASSTTDSKSRKKFQLTVADYRKISKLLVEETKRREDIQTTKKDLVTYYTTLPPRADKPQFDIKPAHLTKVIQGIVDRMVKDKVLIEVGLDGNSSILVVNPHYDMG